MCKLGKGLIIPGKGIGSLRLGMNFKEVTEIIGQYHQYELANATKLVCEDVKIWIDRQTDCVSQILVYGSFEGKFDGWLSLGMTLADVLQKGYSYHDDLGVYILDGVKGLCIELDDESCELDDDEPWNECAAPIARISVYPADADQ